MRTGYPKLLVFHITVVAGTQSLVQQSILKPGLGTQYQQQNTKTEPQDPKETQQKLE